MRGGCFEVHVFYIAADKEQCRWQASQQQQERGMGLCEMPVKQIPIYKLEWTMWPKRHLSKGIVL